MKRLRAIVFDFDGVLVDSVDVKGNAFGALYASDGESVQNQMKAHHQAHGGMPRHEKIYSFETQILGRTIDNNRLDALIKRFAHEVETQVIASDEIAGSTEYLKKFYKKIHFYIASATPEEELKRIVSARNMTKFFKGVFGSPISKADHIRRILSEHSLLPEEVLMIGDAMADFQAAAESGVHFLGRRGHGETPLFPSNTPLISDLNSLERWISENFEPGL